MQHEAEEPTTLDIDHPPSSPELSNEPSTPQNASHYNSHVATSMRKPFIDGNIWESPAFLKRNHLFASGYDIFANEGDEFLDNNREKRLKTGLSNNLWKFADRSPSPLKRVDNESLDTPISARPQITEEPHHTAISVEPQASERTTAADKTLGNMQEHIDASVVEDEGQILEVAPPSPSSTSTDSLGRIEPDHVLPRAEVDSSNFDPVYHIDLTPEKVDDPDFDSRELVEIESGDTPASDKLGVKIDMIPSQVSGSIQHFKDTPRMKNVDKTDPTRSEAQPQPSSPAAMSESATMTAYQQPQQDINEQSITINESPQEFQQLLNEGSSGSSAQFTIPGCAQFAAVELQSHSTTASDQSPSADYKDPSLNENSVTLPSVGEQNSSEQVNTGLTAETTEGWAQSDVLFHRESVTEAEESVGKGGSPITKDKHDEISAENHDFSPGDETRKEQIKFSDTNQFSQTRIDPGLRSATGQEKKAEVINLESEEENDDRSELPSDENESAELDEETEKDGEGVENTDWLGSECETLDQSMVFENRDESVESSQHSDTVDESIAESAYLESDERSTNDSEPQETEGESLQRSIYIDSDDDSIEHSQKHVIEKGSFDQSEYLNSKSEDVEQVGDQSWTGSDRIPIVLPGSDDAVKKSIGRSSEISTASPKSSQSDAKEVYDSDSRPDVDCEKLSLLQQSSVSNSPRERWGPLGQEDRLAQPLDNEAIIKYQPDVEPESRVQEEEVLDSKLEQGFSAITKQGPRLQSSTVETAATLQTAFNIKQPSPGSQVELPSTVPGSVQEPLKKSQLLAPDITQRTSFESQPLPNSFETAPDNDTLPTPRLTQNHSNEIVVPVDPWLDRSTSLERDTSHLQLEDSEVDRKGSPKSQKPLTLIEKLKAMRRLSSQTPQKIGNASAVSPWFKSRRSSIIVPDSEIESGGESLSEEDGKAVQTTAESPIETPQKQKPLAKSFIRSSPDQAKVSSTLSPTVYLSPPRAPPPGFRTNLSYFVPLSTLESHFSQSVDVFAIALSATEVAWATTGPRDYHQTIHVSDPMLSSTRVPVTMVQIFRSAKGCFPIVKKGDAILLREFKVQSFHSQMTLLSAQSSAWAVFHQGQEVQVRGPPIEFGAEERGFARGLWRWWNELNYKSRERLEAALQTREDFHLMADNRDIPTKKEVQGTDRTIKREAIEGLGIDLPGSQSKSNRQPVEKSTPDPDDIMESTEPAKRVLRSRGSKGLPEKSESPTRAVDRSSGTVFTGGLGEPDSE